MLNISVSLAIGLDVWHFEVGTIDLTVEEMVNLNNFRVV